MAAPASSISLRTARLPRLLLISPRMVAISPDDPLGLRHKIALQDLVSCARDALTVKALEVGYILTTNCSVNCSQLWCFSDGTFPQSFSHAHLKHDCDRIGWNNACLQTLSDLDELKLSSFAKASRAATQSLTVSRLAFHPVRSAAMAGSCTVAMSADLSVVEVSSFVACKRWWSTPVNSLAFASMWSAERESSGTSG